MKLFRNRLFSAVSVNHSPVPTPGIELEPKPRFVLRRGERGAFGRVTQRRRMFAFVSAVALVVVFAAGAVPSKANEAANGQSFAISLKDFPDTVARGDKLTGSISIALAPTKPVSRAQVQFQLFVSTPLGDAPVRSGSFTLRTGQTRTIAIEQEVPTDIATGKYAITLVVSINGETLDVTHEFEVV